MVKDLELEKQLDILMEDINERVYSGSFSDYKLDSFIPDFPDMGYRSENIMFTATDKAAIIIPTGFFAITYFISQLF